MREKESAKLQNGQKNGKIVVALTHLLDKKMYNIPLTLKTYVSADWKNVSVQQGKRKDTVKTATDEKGTYVLYQAHPNDGALTLSGV
jgi:hypothetical protein